MIIGLALLSLAQAGHPPPDPAAILAQARAEAQAIADLADSADRPSVRREIARKARSIDALLAELAALPGGGQIVVSVPDPDAGTGTVTVTAGPGGVSAVIGVAPGEPPGPPAEDPSTGGAMAARAWSALLQAVTSADFDDERLALVREAARTNRFTCEQVRALLQAFDFDQGRVEAAVLLHPATVDPGNWFVVYEAFDFDTARNEVRGRIGH